VVATYRDRAEAGAALADRMRPYARRADAVVLGLVRGGVPVAAVVSARLGVPLDVLVVRKLGVPWAPEVAFGAVGPGGVRVLNPEVADRLPPDQVVEIAVREATEVRRQEARYRAGRQPLRLRGRAVILVDDGLATGATARAAVAVARSLDAARIALAVPVGSTEACAALAALVDDLVCPLRPSPFGAVSQHFRDFHQVTDSEVGAVLASSGVTPTGTFE
jgi:putative phosphoribosyl transferase